MFSIALCFGIFFGKMIQRKNKNEINSAIESENSEIFLCYDEENAIGFAVCSLRHDYVEGTNSSPVGYLEGIFVKEEYRNIGLAGKLLSTAEEWARGKGCTEFASDCELDNTVSLSFHLNVGFEEANRIICFKKKL